MLLFNWDPAPQCGQCHASLQTDGVVVANQMVPEQGGVFYYLYAYQCTQCVGPIVYQWRR